MENKDNKPNNETKTEETPKTETSNANTCCSNLFATYDAEGRKKPSILVYAILGVLLIGGVGIATSNNEAQRELIKNTNEQAIQYQKETDVLQTRMALKNRSKDSKKIEQVAEKESMVQKMQVMEQAHSAQMEQAQKEFDNLKNAYSQKLNQIVKTMQKEQEAKEQEVPNPELNFQLRGLSNIRVQFNNAKDVSYIEIIQPENAKSYNSSKQNKEWKNKDYQKSWENCDPKPQCEMPTTKKEYKTPNSESCGDKWNYEPNPNSMPTSSCGAN